MPVSTRPAEKRAEALADRRALGDVRARLEPFGATWRHQPVQLDGKTFTQLDGYASVVELEYEMWDMWGPYGETIEAGAFDETLAAGPDVAFLTNHKGLTMARTKGDPATLTLDVDPRGLHSLALVNPARTDVSDLLTAIDDGNITEMSFAFMILDGEWDDTYEHFRILKVDLDRGDVSAVNYGANPYTSIAARSREIMRELTSMPAGFQRSALARLGELVNPEDAAAAVTRAAAAQRSAGAAAAPAGGKVDFYHQLLDL